MWDKKYMILAEEQVSVLKDQMKTLAEGSRKAKVDRNIQRWDVKYRRDFFRHTESPEVEEKKKQIIM